MNPYLTLAIVAIVYMSFWYLLSLVFKRADIVDIAWGLGFILLSWSSYFISSPGFSAFIVNICITVWGFRLAWHIFLRNIRKPEDPRYQEFRRSWKHFPLRSFFQIFMLQAILLYTISLPVLHFNLNSAASPSLLFCLGLLIWIIGFLFEAVSDWQLSQFLKNSPRGQIMQSGLWKYSRHPNYFGEVTLWWGIFILTLSSPGSFYTIIGPLTITVLILFISGIPLLEKKYQSRPEFKEYASKTSIFFPLPPKSGLKYPIRSG